MLTLKKYSLGEICAKIKLITLFLLRKDENYIILGGPFKRPCLRKLFFIKFLRDESNGSSRRMQNESLEKNSLLN